MPRLVRRRPLRERLASMLNPMDFLLWLSEEMETRDWDSKLIGTQLGLALNFVFLLARANSDLAPADNDVFGGDYATSASWLSYLACFLVWGLAAISVWNGIYSMGRVKRYRMFEANIETQPSTPSARRVKAQSAPASSSPLRYFADMVAPDSAESRSHPDERHDVWELAVWDPLPASLRLFCFFSPGHVLIYLLFLPLAPLDARPSVTVLKFLAVQLVLSTQLLLLSSRFSQQAKDNQIIQKEVMHEYDTKFVRPRLYPVVRDVATQLSGEEASEPLAFVQVGTPATLIRRSFKPHRNPHLDSNESTPGDGDDDSGNGGRSTGSASSTSSVIVNRPQNVLKSHLFTPPTADRRSGSFTPTGIQQSSGLRHSLSASSSATTGFTPSVASAATPARASTPPVVNHRPYTGHMGIHTHNRSPIKKAFSLGDMNGAAASSPRNSREMAAYEQMARDPPSSPTKQRSPSSSVRSSPHPFARMGRHHPQYERFPSRW